MKWLRNQASRSSLAQAAIRSGAPSPSTSAANTAAAPRARSLTVRAVQVLPFPVRFSYQAMRSSKRDAETTSRSPSLSTSAAKMPSGPSAVAPIMRADMTEPSPRSFSYHVMASLPREADARSRSPSPSMSPAITADAPSALRETTCSRHDEPSPATFLYHAILSSKRDADATSTSPSPSMSAAITELAPFAEVEITRSRQCWPRSTFSYQAIFASKSEADSTSRSPSPSTSAAVTLEAPLAWLLTTCVDQRRPRPSRLRCSRMRSSIDDAETTSASPSPSRSPAQTEYAPFAPSAMSCSVHSRPPPARFSYHTMRSALGDAETASRSPSPSTSAPTTLRAPGTAVVTACSDQAAPFAPRFSYQLTSLSRSDAEARSRSPSPSRSAATTASAPFAAVVTVCAVQREASPAEFSYHATRSSL